MAAAELAELVVADAGELREWLRVHHTTSPGVWLALTRKGGTVTTVTWQQAVDEALCVGWIDGQARCCPRAAPRWRRRRPTAGGKRPTRRRPSPRSRATSPRPCQPTRRPRP